MKIKYKIKHATTDDSPGVFNEDAKLYLSVSGLSQSQVNKLAIAIASALND